MIRYFDSETSWLYWSCLCAWYYDIQWSNIRFNLITRTAFYRFWSYVKAFPSGSDAESNFLARSAPEKADVKLTLISNDVEIYLSTHTCTLPTTLLCTHQQCLHSNSNCTLAVTVFQESRRFNKKRILRMHNRPSKRKKQIRIRVLILMQIRSVINYETNVSSRIHRIRSPFRSWPSCFKSPTWAIRIRFRRMYHARIRSKYGGI